MVAILLAFGLEESLQIVSVVNPIEEIEFALGGDPKGPPHFARSGVGGKLSIFVRFRHINVELVFGDRTPE